MQRSDVVKKPHRDQRDPQVFGCLLKDRFRSYQWDQSPHLNSLGPIFLLHPHLHQQYAEQPFSYILLFPSIFLSFTD